MVVRSITPNYEIVQYDLNAATNYYQKQDRFQGFTDLPNELKTEQARQPFLIRQGAQNVIRGRQKDKKYLFFTGLIPTPIENVYTGDNGYNQPQRKSLIVFEFSADRTAITAYFFNGYTKHTAALKQFITGDFNTHIREKGQRV